MHRLTKLDLSEFMSKTVEPEVISVVSDMIHIYNKAINLINEIKQVDSSIKDVFIRKYYDKNDETFWDLHIVTRDNSLVSKDKYDNYEKIQNSTKWDTYNVDQMFQKIVATCPQGLMKTMRITTNALQLKSIISQRSGHKLDEWKYFVNWAKGLYFWRYVNMYMDEVSEKRLDSMKYLDYILYHMLENHKYLVPSQDSEFQLSHLVVDKETNKKRPATKYDFGAATPLNKLKLESLENTLCSVWLSQLKPIWNPFLNAYSTIELIRIALDLKDQVKKLENYILQHAHGKITTEELCDNINQKEEL